VDAEFKSQVPENIHKTDTDKVDYNYTVSEGSVFHVDIRDFLDSKYVHNYQSYSYSLNPTEDVSVIANFSKDDFVFSFKAPYITDDNKDKIQLNFGLTIKDNKNNPIPSNRINVIVKRVQRAIIFQGGVSLGAYEAGVFKALVEKIAEQDVKRGLNGSRPLFDIVAGTSIGAMNGAIVVSDILKDKNWKEAADDLVNFWKQQESQWPTSADYLDMNPLYRSWWDIMHNTGKVSKEFVSALTESFSNTIPYFKEWTDIFMNSPFFDKDLLKDYFMDGWYVPATSEAARRYYSAKQFHAIGAPNVATGIPPWSSFGKYFDFANTLNLLFRPDNKHFPTHSLKKTLEQYVHNPIKTTRKNKEPRFLSITVDVQTGDAVTFDSYEKMHPVKNRKGHVPKDKEGNTIKYYSEYGDAQNKHIIFYNNGVEMNHILASGTFPGFFDYPKFEVENVSDKNPMKEDHIFWDGGFRSNTPLRELIQSHRDYYFDKNNPKDEDSVPDLEIYIADLWPSQLKEQPISFDLDFVDNRKYGLQFGDKTDYDEQVANVVTDYIDLTKELRNLARKNKIPEDEINSILYKKGNSQNREGYKREYIELLQGRFRITKVVRIDHKDDGHEVGNKIFDYSYATIEKLMKDGYHDALIKMAIESLKDEFVNLDDKFTKLEKKNQIHEHNTNTEKLKEEFQQIQLNIKIENEDDTIKILDRIDVIIDKVRSLSDDLQENNRSIKEEKALSISGTKLE